MVFSCLYQLVSSDLQIFFYLHSPNVTGLFLSLLSYRGTTLALGRLVSLSCGHGYSLCLSGWSESP